MFVNRYSPPAPLPRRHPDPVAWEHPLPPLRTARVLLQPFAPLVHTAPFLAGLAQHPDVDVYRFLPWALRTADDLLAFADRYRAPGFILFAIIDRTRPDDAQPAGRVAGLIGLMGRGPLAVEVGPVIVLPAFQRTFVASNAIGILLRYCLELDAPGLGFRRVQWTANPLNGASVRVAERMGFRREGTLRWLWVLAEGKEGKERPGDARPGRDSALLAICWDDWERGVREHVDRAIDRP